MPCFCTDALLGAWCPVVDTLSALCQHRMGEREAQVETGGEAEDKRQTARGRGGGSKAGVLHPGSKKMSHAHAGRRGREEGKWRATPLSCKHGAMPDAGPRACRRAQPLDNAFTHLRCCPARSPAHHCCLGCLSHAMRGMWCNRKGHAMRGMWCNRKGHAQA